MTSAPVPGPAFLIIGLGTAGTEHLRALEYTAGGVVIGVVDPAPPQRPVFHGRPVPLYESLFDARSSGADPETIVIATPTASHAGMCAEASEYFPAATILMEKPAADNLAGARSVLEGVGGKQNVRIAYHMAYAPEVEWALSQARRHAGLLGQPVMVECWQADPYQGDLASARSRLGTSWVDSAINALSVLERFVTPVARTSFRAIDGQTACTYEGKFRCRSGASESSAVVLTTWRAISPSRTTRICYDRGSELVMDHAAAAAYLRIDGDTVSTFASDGTVPRRASHYRRLYESWLTRGEPLLSAAASLRLHEILLE